MKKFLLLLVVTGFLFQAVAQKTLPDVVNLDFLQPELFGRYTTAPYGHKIVFRIQNINRSLYKINESFTQTDFNTTLPGLFSNISLPGYLSLSLPARVEDMQEFYASPSAALGHDSIEHYLAIISQSSRYVGTTPGFNNKLANLYQACGISYRDIERETIEITRQFLPLTLPATRKAQAAGIKTTLEAAVEDAVNAEIRLRDIIPLYRSEIRAQVQKSEDVIWEWDKFPLPKKDPDYRARLTQYRMAKQEFVMYEEHLDSLNSILKAANSLVTALAKFRDDNRIHALVNNYELINESNFTYYTDTLLVNGDELKLSVKVTATKALPCAKYGSLAVEQTYRTKGGWKVDFSTGVLFNGGNEDFLGSDYSYRPETDSTASIGRKDGGGRVLLSLGAFLHIYKRSGTKLNFALSPGLSTTTAFDGLMFHLGGSALFGQRERLVVTVGAIAREVEVLDNYFQEGAIYPVAELPNSPPMVKVFPRMGWFVSITYNWSALRKR